jgi:hypothetical protein
LEQSFYKKSPNISDYLVRNRSGFLANILQKREDNPGGFAEIPSACPRLQKQKSADRDRHFWWDFNDFRP